MNEIISTKELAQRLAGGDSYIRTKNGEVKGLALRLDMNPDAPKRIIVGNGPLIEKRARLLEGCKKAVPVYIKQAINKWKHVGFYRAIDYRQDKITIELYRCHRPAENVAGIIFMEAVGEDI